MKRSSARRLLLTILAAGLLLSPSAALADTYLCIDKKSGDSHFTNKKRVKGMRCSLFSKSPPRATPAPDPAPASPAQPASIEQPAQPAPTGAQPAPQPARPQIQYIPVPVYTNRPAPAGQPQVGAVIEEHRPRLAPADEPRERAGREQLYLAYVEEAAELYQLPQAFLMALIRVESDFRYRKRDKARDKLGLMGLTSDVARDLGVTDRFDPRASVLGGARRVRQLANQHDGDIVAVLSHWLTAEAPASDSVMSEPLRDDVRELLDHFYAYEAAEGLEGGLE